MVDRFDKFTERARRVLALAQEEAQRLNHNYIGTEHLLLGLVREGDGIAARVLNNLGVQLPKVRAAVELRIGRGATMQMGEIGLTTRAKKVVDLTVDEARRLNHHYIGTEHILLGLVREGGGIAAEVLRGLGVELDKLRAQVIRVLSQSGGGLGVPGDPLPTGPDTPPELTQAMRDLEALRRELDATIAAQDFDRASALRETERQLKERIGALIKAWQQERPQRPWQSGSWQVAGPTSGQIAPFTPEAQQVMAFAEDEARRLDHNYIGTEHILLGLTRLETGLVLPVLANLGVELTRIRSAVGFIIGRGEIPPSGSIGLTPRGQKAVELATDEARRLNHHAIGSEHLLLGLVREGEGIAAGVLASMGVMLDKVRAQVIQQGGQRPIIRPGIAVPPPDPPLDAPVRQPLGELLDILPVVVRAEREATVITVLALERYDNGFMVTFRLVASGAHRTLPVFAVTGVDDTGQRYEAILHGGTGGGRGPGHYQYEWRFAYRFAPALDPAARALTVDFAFTDLSGVKPAEPPPTLWTFAIPLGDSE